ncbi:MAG TPA: TIGR03435 family protein [Bryobacteraceae bacterium]|nr:TIGR03435 family protein [Bryobacteraceae bacterium]
MHRIVVAAGVATLALVNAPGARAQSTGVDVQKPPSFEVASIKPGDPSSHQVQIRMSPGGRISCKNVPVRFLLQRAFDIQDFQIVGAPAWVGSDRFDIEAKADHEVNQEEIALMLQSLLADRFKLTFHRETKELPIYSLVVGKNGPKLKESEGGSNGKPMAGGPPMPGGQPMPGGKPMMVRMGRGMIEANGASMETLAGQLARNLGRPVIDKTGLAGSYDVKLEWTPDEQAAGPGGPGGPGGPEPKGDAVPTAESAGPSLFTAVQEQLGLKLDGGKGPVKVIVIDHIEKASEN